LLEIPRIFRYNTHHMAAKKTPQAAIERQENGTIKLTIQIPWEQVKKVKNEVIEEAVNSTELAGFRKGKAPREMVEKNLDQTKLTDEVLKRLLPQSYIETVQSEKINPIMNPKIQIENVKEGEDWQFTALTCETPVVTLGKYKDAVTKITAKSKIIIPGKEPVEPNFDEIMKAVIDSVDVTVPPLIVEQEVDRLLSHMLEEIKKLGLTLDQYMTSTGKTPEALRKEYEDKAIHDIKVELTLQKIAETENITIEDKEIDEAVQKAKDPQEKEHLESNRYLLASILRQQKTLDFLRNL
jgi:FKBP-type peptidyl-prolyl cis-trans isomerase (trigger factor)